MKKRVLSLFLVMVMLITMCPVTVSAAEVTEISDQAGLAAMKDSAASYKLTSDITLDDAWVEFTPKAGTTLDGNGYTITLSGKRLFESLNSTDVIKNLILTGNVTEANRRNTGALAGGSSATIRNCMTSATVSFTNSGATTYYVGGFVGKINGGTISNCVSTAVINQGDSVVYGGIGSFEQFFGDTVGKIENCYVSNCERVASVLDFMTDTSVAADLTGKTYSENNTVLDETDDLNAVTSSLNDTRISSDLEWAVENGELTLKRAVVTDEGATDEQIATLKEAITEAEDVDTDTIYTADSFAAFDAALEAAKEVADAEKPKQDAVAAATEELTEAMAALAERALSPVDSTDMTVIEVDQSYFNTYMDSPVAGSYYVLTEDISIGTYWFGTYKTFDAVLDGNGHTITLIGSPLYEVIGEDGVIQNLGILGSAQYSTNDTGAIAKDCQGLIVNCWSMATVTSEGSNNTIKNTGGFVANLKSGGAIVNSYVAGSITAKGNTGSGAVGALAGTSETNTIVKDCFWLKATSGSAAVGAANGIVTGCAVKTDAAFKDTDDVLAALNNNRGSGKAWTQSSSGYPHLGDAQEYDPVEPIDITFTNYKGEEIVFSSEDGLSIPLSARNTTTDLCYAGELSAKGVTSWDNLSYDSTGQNNSVLLYDTDEDGCAEVYIYEIGSAEVKCNDADSTQFSITVTAAPKVHALRLKAGDTTYTDGANLTVQGSEYVDFSVEAQYEEDGDWEALPADLLTFTGTGNAYLSGNTFHATAPGEMTVTATYEGVYAEGDTNKIDTKSLTINITSEYVAVTSITPAANGTYTVHERNANSDGSGEFLDLKLGHGVGSVIIEPGNASYQGWALTSSDPDVAEYVDAFLKAVLPKKAGTTTLTAVSADPEANVSGISELTIVYKNPVTAVSFTGENNTMTVEANKSAALPLTFTGSEGMDAYHVTEPGMTWTYNSTDGGEVRIVRDGNLGVIVGAEDSTEYCVANDKYKIYGEAAGTVTVTGTPVDTTGGAQPVTFTVTVTAGEAEQDANEAALVAQGIAGATEYLLEQGAANYVFGNEWEIFSLIRSGTAIDQSKLDAYLASVKSTYTAPIDTDDLKPTTIARVVLTLGVLGKDASNFECIDFISMLCHGDQITAGGNEPMWALIALDSMDYTVPADADWTRVKLKDELIDKYQCQDGSFGLSGKTEGDTDLTAMAVTALAPYYSEDKVKTAVDSALTYLKNVEVMDRDCVISATSESTAQTLLAVSTMGIDATDMDAGFAKSVARNLITALMKFQVSGEGFKHEVNGSETVMSSSQALMALEAYNRFVNGEADLYDLTALIGLYDITAVEPAHGAIEVAASAKAGTTVTVTLKPDLGYVVDKLYIGGELTAVTDNTATFPMPASDVVISASFKLGENASSELTAVMAALTNDDVKDADEEAYELLSEIDSAIAALDLSESELAALKETDAYKNYAEKLDKFEEELKELQDKAEDDLDDLFEKYDEKDYTEQNWKKLEDIYEDALYALDDALYAEKIEDIVDEAEKDMDDVPVGGALEVTFRLIGDFKHEGGVTDHGEYVTWIETTEYTLDAGATMYDLFMMAIDDFDLNQKGAKNNYVESIQAPDVLGGYWIGEFDNGRNSGWMYTIDGKHPGTGLVYQKLEDGDEVIWHYVDDYVKEERNSSSQYYERWLEARDISPEKYVERTIGEIVTVGKHGSVKPNLGIKDIGKDITFKFQPDNGYVVKDVIIDGESMGAIESYTYKDLSIDSRIEVTFVPAGMEDILNVGKHGSAYPELELDDLGKNITFTFVPDAGYVVGNVIVDGKSVGAVTSYTYKNLSLESRIEVVFALAEEITFADVAPGIWYSEPIQYVAANGLFSGTGNGKFSPDMTMSRAMMVTVLHNMAQNPTAYNANLFGDVAAGAWYDEAVRWATANGIASGYPGGKFGTNDDVTREQIAVFLYNYAKAMGHDVSSYANLTSYADDQNVSTYAKTAMQWAVAEGIISGRSGNKLAAKSNASRAEVAAMVYNFMENVAQ